MSFMIQTIVVEIQVFRFLRCNGMLLLSNEYQILKSYLKARVGLVSATLISVNYSASY